MIDPKSLRCGNLVTIDNDWHPRLNGVWHVVFGIDESPRRESTHVIRVKNEFDEVYAQSNQFISPIPLTDEVLIRAWFTSNERGSEFHKNYGFNGVFIIRFERSTNSFYILLGKGLNLECKYLHTLQNAWHLFTEGTELEIK